MSRSAASAFDQLNVKLRSQFGMLTAMFLLGMAVNLIGLPDEATGFWRTASICLLVLHVLVAIGLIVGAVQIRTLSEKAGAPFRTFGMVGSAGVGVAFLGGILTMATHGNNWWSYVMAVGFISAMIGYGRLWVLVAAHR